MRPSEHVPPARWWNNPWLIAAIVLAGAIPLLRPDIPPLVDLPGHMARYRVQLDSGATPVFAQWYRFDWSLIGNLGIDLLIEPLAWLIGLEPAVKLIVMTIPVLTASGLLWIAREVHGRIPPSAFWALPLVYSFPFHFGFVNFALSVALALNTYALWLRLARTGHVRLRAALFVPISLLIWITHAFGWGVLGVLAFSGELIRQRDRGYGWIVAWFRAGIACTVLALPLAAMVIWRSGSDVSGQTADFFNWQLKWRWAKMTLSDRWRWFDLASLASLGVALVAGLRNPAYSYSRNLALSAVFLLAVYLLLPRIIFGSAYADMRLAPFVIAIALIALRPRPRIDPRFASLIAAAAIAFFAVRTGATTVSYWMFARDYDRELAALDHLPRGARLVTFVGGSCRMPWKMSRLEHLAGIALVRRGAFANDQWSMAGGQLLTVRYLDGRWFSHDPSQIVVEERCPRQRWITTDESLTGFPRDSFDYVWLIDPPPYDARSLNGLTTIWRSGNSRLLKVERQPLRNGV